MYGMVYQYLCLVFRVEADQFLQWDIIKTISKLLCRQCDLFESKMTVKKNYAFGAGSFSHDGSTPQISRAYSAIVRSLENFPLDAILLIDISNHFA